jgi:hypothetical protein
MFFYRRYAVCFYFLFVQCSINRYPVQPGRKSRSAFKACLNSYKLLQTHLCYFFRIFPVQQNIINKCEHHIPVPAYKHLVCRCVTCKCIGYDLLVCSVHFIYKTSVGGCSGYKI